MRRTLGIMASVPENRIIMKDYPPCRRQPCHDLSTKEPPNQNLGTGQETFYQHMVIRNGDGGDVGDLPGAWPSRTVADNNKGDSKG